MSALKKLEEIVICGKIVVIEDSVFNNCESLTSFKINKSGTIRIGKNQFTNCKKLQTIDIDSTTEIGQNGPSTVEFGIFCFSGATKLKTFTIKGGDVKISNDCFKTCSSLTELYFLDVNTIVIEENLFSTCQSLNSVIIQSKNLINLGIGCFSNLKELKLVNLVGKYINIENSCFMNCTSLAVFVIDQTIDFTLKKGVFTKCDALKDINIGVSRKLIVVDESLNQSCLSSVTLQGKEITIGKECFKNCDYINKFTILAADTVELGTSAFENCKKFTEITVNAVASLTILDQCFYNDVNLKLININASEISIKKLAFSKCASIQFLQIEESIDKIVLNESAFSECTGLIQATFNSKEKFQTHPNCFYNAKNLKTVLITSQIILINNSCFSNCSSMTSFTIWEAKNVLFATKAFDNCKSLEQIEVTASDEFKAYTFCFNNNFKLKRVSFKCKKISIADKCFENCSALTRVNCPLATEIKCFTSAFKKNYQNYLVHPASTKITTLTNNNDDDDKCSIF